MFSSFFKKKNASNGSDGVVKLAKPKELPSQIGRHMVVEMQLDPDWVWNLKYVSYPDKNNSKSFKFRIFSEQTAHDRGVSVSNFTSLDDHQDIILFDGFYDSNISKVNIESRS